MTAATSTAKKSFFGIHFRNRIKENKKILIINSILELIGLPVIAVVGLIAEHMYEAERYDAAIDFEAIMMASFIAITISLATGIVIALFSFRYLFTKSLVDMTYSLPLTSKQRFFADYLSGLAIYTVPAIIAALLSLIILGIGSAFVDISTLWENFPQLLMMGFIVFVGMIMLYTFTVLTTVCCGSTFEAVFSIFTANIVIPVTVYCVFSMIQDASNYVLSSQSLLSNLFLTSTNPAGIVIFLEYFISNSSRNFSFVSSLFIRWLIPILIVIAAYIIAAFLLYKHRKAEQVSKPYVYKIFYYIILTLAVFCMLSVFIINGDNPFAYIIVCAIFFFIIEVITKRGFSRFWESILRFGISVALVFVFSGICESTDGFGCAKYVPREIAVDSVRIESYELDINIDYDIIFDDKEVIRNVIALHKELSLRSDSYDGSNKLSTEEFENDTLYVDLSNCSISITYYLKNGATVIRDYYVNPNDAADLMSSVARSEEYAKSISEQFALQAFNSTNNFQQYYTDIDDVPHSAKAIVSVCDKLGICLYDQTLSYEQTIALMNAYRADITAMTDEEYRTADVYGYFVAYEYLAIRETFVNTIDLLEKFGNEDITVDRDYIEKNILPSENINILTDVVALYNYDNEGSPYHYWKEYTKYYIIDNLTSTHSHNYSYTDCYAQITDEEPDDCLIKIIERATPIIIDDSVAGAITFSNSRVLFLPDTAENRTLLKEAKEKYIDGNLISAADYESYADDYYID